MNSLCRIISLVVGLMVVAGGTPFGWAQETEGDRSELLQDNIEETVQEPWTPAASATPVTASEDSGLISIDFKDADIRQVLRVISLKSSVDIVAGNDVEGLVSIKLTKVPWEQALDIILRTYGFTYERKNNIVRVMTLEALEQEALATRVFPLDYAKASEVPGVINEMLSDRGRIKFDERTNTVIVTDVPTSIFQIGVVIDRLDTRTPQVLIETRIVETKLEEDEQLGIRWSDSLTMTQTASAYPSSFPFLAGTSFGLAGDHFISPPTVQIPGPSGLLTSTTLGSIGIGTLSGPALAMTLNALRSRTDTKIISNPTLVVLNNQEAKILIGEEFPVPTFSIDPATGNTQVSGFETKDIGTVLVVTPHVNPSGEIVVDLKPEVITALSNAKFVLGGSTTIELPRFSTQTVETQVRVRNGETIAIGGLVKDTHITTVSKVPILGDIPILGRLFTNTKHSGGGDSPTLQQDLLIFLTVTLLDDPPPERSLALSRSE